MSTRVTRADLPLLRRTVRHFKGVEGSLEAAEAHRRKGLGRELLRAFMTEGSKAGATKMFLFTAADNVAARSLYKSLGGGMSSQGDTVNYWFLLESLSM